MFRQSIRKEHIATIEGSPSKTPLSPGAKAFISVVTLVSAPGYITALALICGYTVELIVGRYHSSPSYIRTSDVVKTAVAVLALLGILTHAAALLMASIGSFSRMSGRGKALAWKIVLGGVLGWAFAYAVVWIPYAHQ